ncbi:hypothetical protein BpHYR1_051521 [Brachionus plicatilis]|uniref:Uncharacterized protein n=1 Tax=Brachionus plicatilis TaxID=10195 RepID=A0A3M7R8Z5_BRAPC|nr:hypothetical protein BpHYR1_051521 [Brachionus plicatilis]
MVIAKARYKHPQKTPVPHIVITVAIMDANGHLPIQDVVGGVNMFLSSIASLLPFILRKKENLNYSLCNCSHIKIYTK